MNMPINERADNSTVQQKIFYAVHAKPRGSSRWFEQTKVLGHKQKLPCMISGHTEGVEYHHFFCEWAFMDAVDWVTVKGVALGTITRLPVLDLATDQPLATGETFEARNSLLWIICKLVELRGFDWNTFNPAQPEMLVDSIYNMLVLHEKFHRAVDHGIHMLTFPVWVFQAFPRREGFVFTPDELQALPAVKTLQAMQVTS